MAKVCTEGRQIGSTGWAQAVIHRLHPADSSKAVERHAKAAAEPPNVDTISRPVIVKEVRRGGGEGGGQGGQARGQVRGQGGWSVVLPMTLRYLSGPHRLDELCLTLAERS